MIPKNKKGKMTIDKLAQITANGFLEMDKKFDKRFNEVDKRFNKVENAVTGLRSEFNDFKLEVNQKMDNGVNKMLVIADGMAKQFSNWKQENAFGASIEARQDEQLKDHEIRIKKFEIV